MNAAADITQDDVTRALPHALGMEKSLLSSMLQDPQEWIPAAIEMQLTPAHFYLPAHAFIFEMLADLFARGEEIELVTLTQRLLDRGELDRIGGPAALADIHNYAPSPGSFRQHARTVREKYTLRELIRVSGETIAAAYERPEEAGELLDATEAAILAIREAGESTREQSTREAVGEVLEAMQRKIRGESTGEGLRTGFEKLDAMTRGGIKPGEMFVIAARPSMGKTALALNIAEAVAIEQGLPVMIFSLEMSRRALTQRMIHARARISPAVIAAGWKPTMGELPRLQRAAQDIATARLFIDETEALTIAALRAKARRKHRTEGLALIAIDYLQLMKSTSRQAMNSREREISEISAGIKALAKELKIPILILAQLNRAPESRGGKQTPAGVPRMSDLRESGAIEQDADLVGLLYRAAYYAETDRQREELSGRAELILAKNRNGETGSVPLTFIADLTRFESGAPAVDIPRAAPPANRFAHLND
jgi:replicative DNA helicase